MSPRAGFVRREWTTAELEQLRVLGPTHTLPQAAAALGRTKTGVQKFAQRHKVSFAKQPGESWPGAKYSNALIQQAWAMKRYRNNTTQVISEVTGIPFGYLMTIFHKPTGARQSNRPSVDPIVRRPRKETAVHAEP